jgi:hypothetical protein
MSFYKPSFKSGGSGKFYAKKTSVAKERIVDDGTSASFMEDWLSLRTRHAGQQEIIDAFFIDGKKYVFVRFGRKGAKTATNIDIAWRFANENPRSTIFVCLPTITQAIEVYWDEKRLQWCDIQDPWMCEKYVDHIDNNKHMLTFKNGSIVKLIGTWSESRGRGTQPNLLIVDELADCSGEYLDAVEPNLAAKPDARCVMSGTPPKKKNHFHEWENRILANEDGFHRHYSSYINTALPHLSIWLDKKREELILAGKEDVWLREYMAEDCFRSDDRVLPDIQFLDGIKLLENIRYSAMPHFPIVGVVVTYDKICVNFSSILYNKYIGTQLFTFDSLLISRLWDMGYNNLNQRINAKIDQYSHLFDKSWRKVVFDETDTLTHVLSGFHNSRKDLLWKNRGIPLLREMILSNTIHFSDAVSQIGVESQNMLKDDNIFEFPIVCSAAILCNEYYQAQSLSKPEQERWDKYAPLREAGIATPKARSKGKTWFQKNWG